MNNYVKLDLPSVMVDMVKLESEIEHKKGDRAALELVQNLKETPYWGFPVIDRLPVNHHLINGIQVADPSSSKGILENTKNEVLRKDKNGFYVDENNRTVSITNFLTQAPEGMLPRVVNGDGSSYRMNKSGSQKSSKPFTCNLCSYKTDSAGNLKEHMLTHTGEKPFACTLCNYKTARLRSLKPHMLTHLGQEPYQCNMCSYKTIRASDLKRHRLTHTGEKPFTCTLCNYKATTIDYLKKHNLTHTGKKCFTCSLCSYKSMRAANLKFHMLTHTSDKPFGCALCNYKTDQANDLKIHKSMHKLTCSLCSHITDNVNSFKTHMINHKMESVHVYNVHRNMYGTQCVT